MGLGISPVRSEDASVLAFGSALGTALSRKDVYGCAGDDQISPVGPDSQTFPRNMTQTLSEICRTTERSWLINRYVSRRVLLSSERRLRIWFWTETSRADTGSSQTMTSGDWAMALAMPIRCR